MGWLEPLSVLLLVVNNATLGKATLLLLLSHCEVPIVIFSYHVSKGSRPGDLRLQRRHCCHLMVVS